MAMTKFDENMFDTVTTCTNVNKVFLRSNTAPYKPHNKND